MMLSLGVFRGALPAAIAESRDALIIFHAGYFVDGDLNALRERTHGLLTRQNHQICHLENEPAFSRHYPEPIDREARDKFITTQVVG